MARMKHIENYSDQELYEMSESKIESLIDSEAKRAGIVIPKEPNRPDKPFEPDDPRDLYKDTIAYALRRLACINNEQGEWLKNKWDYDENDTWYLHHNDYRVMGRGELSEARKPTKIEITRYEKQVKEYKKEIKKYNKDLTIYDEVVINRNKIIKQYEEIDYNVREKRYVAIDTIDILNTCVPKYIDYISIAKGDKDMAYNFLAYTNPEVTGIKDFRLKVMEHVLDSSL